MSAASLQSQIRSLELQMQAVKRQFYQLISGAPTKSFGDFYGAVPGGCVATDADFEAAKYRFAWEGAELGGDAP